MTEGALPAPIVRARDLYRFYHAGDDEVLALRGVSIDANRGEIVGVSGPSGSGKSTLLACLAGLDDPDGGTVTIGGHRMSRQPEKVRARVRRDLVGVMYQSGNLLPQLSVLANVRLSQGLARSRDAPDALTLLNDLGIGGKATAKPATLSGGETARAGLAVALANAPAVVLADEPTAELDAGNERRLLDLLRHRAAAGLCIVVASHSPAVLAWVDRIVRLTDGRISPALQPSGLAR